MEETMPSWARDLKASIDQTNQKLQELEERIDRLENKRKDATKLKPVQENDGVADHKSDEGETESKPMDLEDSDEVKANKVEAINIDQSEQNWDEVFKLSTDKIDGENVSELVINVEGFKDAIIVPHYSLSPSTTTTSHTSASSPPLIVFVPTPLHNPPHHSLPHQHRYYQSDPPPLLIAQPDLSHCCCSILPFVPHLDMFVIFASDGKCQCYLICWEGYLSSDDSWSSKDKLRWLDLVLLERYQSGLIQDPTDSTPFDPGGIADDHVARELPQPDLMKITSITSDHKETEEIIILQLDGVEFLPPREN